MSVNSVSSNCCPCQCQLWVLLWVCGARFDFVAHILQLELHGRHIWGPRPTSRWWGYLLIYVREHSGSPTTINTWLSSWWKGKEVARRPPDVLMIVMAILYLTRCEFSAVLHCSRVTLLYCSHSTPSTPYNSYTSSSSSLDDRAIFWVGLEEVEVNTWLAQALAGGGGGGGGGVRACQSNQLQLVLPTKPKSYTTLSSSGITSTI